VLENLKCFITRRFKNNCIYSGILVVKALGYKLEDSGFDTR
jgi:hypothetical protein